MSIRQVILVTAVACVALAAAACGGSSSSSSGGSTVAAGAGSTSTLSVGGSSESLGGGGSGFCADAKGKLVDMEHKMAQIALIASEPERLKQQMNQLQSFAAGAEADAPGEIKPDIAVFVGYLTHIANAFKQANYDPTVAAASIAPYIQQSQGKLDAASKHIKAWAAANCGL